MEVSNRKPSWGTRRTVRWRAAAETWSSGTPPTRIRPWPGSANRHRSLAKVVFPDPVSPTTATVRPAGIVTDTCCSTGTVSVPR